MLSPETLRALAAIAERHGLLVLSDEIYEKLIYDGREHVSFASLPGMRERTVTVNGFSKAYAMCGWRLGYLAAPEAMVTPMVKIREYMTSCVTTFAQFGAIAALEGPQAPRLAMAEEFARRRALVVEGLRAIPGVADRAARRRVLRLPERAGARADVGGGRRLPARGGEGGGRARPGVRRGRRGVRPHLVRELGGEPDRGARAYDDVAPWPERADGNGSSLQIENVEEDLLDRYKSGNWVASRELKGSPAAAGSRRRAAW